MLQNSIMSARFVVIHWLQAFQKDFKVNQEAVRKLGKENIGSFFDLFEESLNVFLSSHVILHGAPFQHVFQVGVVVVDQTEKGMVFRSDSAPEILYRFCGNRFLLKFQIGVGIGNFGSNPFEVGIDRLGFITQTLGLALFCIPIGNFNASLERDVSRFSLNADPDIDWGTTILHFVLLNEESDRE